MRHRVLTVLALGAGVTLTAAGVGCDSEPEGPVNPAPVPTSSPAEVQPVEAPAELRIYRSVVCGRLAPTPTIGEVERRCSDAP